MFRKETRHSKKAYSFWVKSKFKLKCPYQEGVSVGEAITPPKATVFDYPPLAESPTNSCNVVYQRVVTNDSLFYAPILVQGSVELKPLDSGSMGCTLSEVAEHKLIDKGVLQRESSKPSKIILVGCGGKQTPPKCKY